MTCKDCIHCEICLDGIDNDNTPCVENNCITFKDKSRFVELPCKVGDTVFFDTHKHGEEVGIQPHKVIRVDVIATTDGFTGATLYAYDFGKTVFFTREEAEKKLEEINKA